MTFSAPITLVLIHSIGLYSAAGTCFSAAACTTISMPAKSAVEALAVANVADEVAQRFAAKVCGISYCFSSSRE